MWTRATILAHQTFSHDIPEILLLHRGRRVSVICAWWHFRLHRRTYIARVCCWAIFPVGIGRRSFTGSPCRRCRNDLGYFSRHSRDGVLALTRYRRKRSAHHPQEGGCLRRAVRSGHPCNQATYVTAWQFTPLLLASVRARALCERRPGVKSSRTAKTCRR